MNQPVSQNESNPPHNPLPVPSVMIRNEELIGERTVAVTGSEYPRRHLVDSLCASGFRVIFLSSTVTEESTRSAQELASHYGERFEHWCGSLAESEVVNALVKKVDLIYHFPGYSTPLDNEICSPHMACQQILMETLNLLDAMRNYAPTLPLILTSSSLVYGPLHWLNVRKNHSRLEPDDPVIRRRGLSESTPLEFYTAQGCAIGALDQCALEYAAAYGLCVTVLRFSEIYGPYAPVMHNWLMQVVNAHRNSLSGENDLPADRGKVRDYLFVSDAIAALRAAGDTVESCAGRAFNIGGGVALSLSVDEMMAFCRMPAFSVGANAGLHETDRTPNWVVLDNHRFQMATRWKPKVGIKEGLEATLQEPVASPAPLPYAIAV